MMPMRTMIHPTINKPDVTFITEWYKKGSIAAIEENFPKAFQFDCSYHCAANKLLNCKEGKAKHSPHGLFRSMVNCGSLLLLNAMRDKNSSKLTANQLKYRNGPMDAMLHSIRRHGVQWVIIFFYMTIRHHQALSRWIRQIDLQGIGLWLMLSMLLCYCYRWKGMWCYCRIKITYFRTNNHIVSPSTLYSKAVKSSKVLWPCVEKEFVAQKIKLAEIEELELCGDMNVELGDDNDGKMGEIWCGTNYQWSWGGNRSYLTMLN